MKAIILDFYGVIFDPTTGTPIVGVKEFLQLAQSNQLPCAVASSTGSNSIQDFLEQHQLADYITVVIGADKVSALKPDPECYIQAAEELGCVPADCLVIDDTLAPLNNAQRLGFQTIHFHGDMANFITIAKQYQLE